MNTLRLAIGVFAGTVLATGATNAAAAQGSTPAGNLLTLAPLRVIDPAFIDTTAKACVDFFQFANGGWLRTDTIPAAYASSGVSRDMGDRNELVVRSVLDDVMQRRAQLAPGTTDHKLGAFYATCMDSSATEAAGVAPLRPVLDSIARVRTRDALVRETAVLQQRGVDVLFGFGPSPDPHDAARYVAWVVQAGLGMPDRDYYTETGRSADSLRRAYVAHIAATFQLAGETPVVARTEARQILALETSLAKASLKREVLRDPSATDHPMRLTTLQSVTPALRWSVFFHEAGLTVPVTRLNVAEPAFVRKVDRLLSTAPMPVWRAYLRYHVLAAASPWLSTPFVTEDFAFKSRFSGAKELLPRWKRCLRETDGDIGEALGQAYVAKAFSPEAKVRARAVIDDVREAFRARVVRLTWMSDSTRARALDKLAHVHEKVGYPDQWRDYSRLVVDDGPFVDNVFRANRFEWQRTINRPGAPVDTSEWGITVPTVNAYYDPSKNEMVFPAGALVPQTFDPTTDDAANYGSLAGSWAGHELTHGFDDQGRHYDAHGNLREWWTAADALRFTAQADRVVRQFNGYIQVDTFHVNGRLTLGENIADYGGILTGYDAFQRALERRGRPPLIDGFTPEQRFFISFAQSFRGQTRPEELRTRVTTDPHSPERWRVNGPLANDTSFAQAFSCKAGDPMVRPSDVVPQIW
jgi:putative endopeptidase